MIIIAALIFFGTAAINFFVPLELWFKFTSVFLVLLSVAGIFDLYLTKVITSPGDLTVVSLFRRKVIPREQIASVAWEAGSRVSLKLTNGQWFGLPEVGRGGSQGLANSIRAWLRRTAQNVDG